MSVSNGGRAVDQLAADTGRAEILCCQSSGVVVFYLVQHRAQILVKVNAVDHALMSDGVDILIGGVDQQLEVVRLAAVFPPFADLRIGVDGGDRQHDRRLGAEPAVNIP